MVEILASDSDRSVRSLVDLERGLVSRQIYVNEDIYRQESRSCLLEPSSLLAMSPSSQNRVTTFSPAWARSMSFWCEIDRRRST